MVPYFHFTLSLVELALGRHARAPLWSRHLFSTTRLSARQGSNNDQQNAISGRGRYGKAGTKKKVQNIDSESRVPEQQLVPPPLTVPHGPRPTYFTCRHTYESTLMAEIEYLIASASTEQWGRTKISSPAPGLVRLESPWWDDTSINREEDEEEAAASVEYSRLERPQYLDPVYALQTLPNCVVVAADSIKGLGQAIYSTLLGEILQDPTVNHTMKSSQDVRCVVLRESLRQAPRATLATHGLVPGMFKGQKNPILERRAQKVAEELTTTIRKAFPAARKQLVAAPTEENGLDGVDSTIAPPDSSERWLLQILLMTPDVAVASLVKCQTIDNSISIPTYWPNWSLPAGLAKVDITDESMPSSAYRKLMEALECMGIRPDQSSRVYDLGACPGGWTWILRHYLDCSVTAVDRSELDVRLMKDPRIDFVSGDAFSFVPTPELSSRPGNVWMVSDVIAFPDRILELLERWCGQKWAQHMIVTMKFHGTQPDFPALQQAIDLARHHGYHIRAKHFFNNKNEVTLMLTCNVYNAEDDRFPPRVLEPGVLGTPMYSAILPRER